ncbi:GntR family transcriptional regulator [Herbiconiux sp. VKM Ac-1786]|uniref:GntR family transcriptional regulator n=1 Tax=Herbiconiux sp. VKM Ac-1786 TaxID=2783824 RepID=UPI001889C5AD|nr:GntR family transcriptional regulator [Herbiconiux sp. VKM Ac-1786]MBF4571831.1 GntR family transcriptional regulator [Herbiconiux sp. VKM Ac-1786]
MPQYGMFEIRAVDPDAPEPLYVQIRTQIEQAIVSGRLSKGQLLLPERELADRFEVTRMTLRQAVSTLEMAGLLSRLPGVGTFVSERMRVEDVLSFSDKAKEQGRTPGSRLLVAEVVPGIPSINMALHLPPRAELVHIRRLRSVNGLPVQVGSGHLESARFPGMVGHLRALGDASFYTLLREVYGVVVHQVHETIEAAVVGPEQAPLLECDPGLPAFLRELTAVTEDGEPVEYGHTLVRGDRCNYSFTLTQRNGATGALSVHFDTRPDALSPSEALTFV